MAISTAIAQQCGQLSAQVAPLSDRSSPASPRMRKLGRAGRICSRHRRVFLECSNSTQKEYVEYEATAGDLEETHYEIGKNYQLQGLIYPAY